MPEVIRQDMPHTAFAKILKSVKIYYLSFYIISKQLHKCIIPKYRTK